MWRRVMAALALALSSPAFAAAEWISGTPLPGAIALAADGRMARIVTDPNDHAVVEIAAQDLREDFAAVTGAKAIGDSQIWIGTLGKNAAIDRLAASGRIDVSRLRGAWESFLITVVDRPAPGVARALVIIGSDRRGTAFGSYELAQAIGVSPWAWWADVTPTKRPALYAAAGTRRFGPPSVQYRGIFLNDEDWGMIPWAANHAPGEPPIGPKTHARLFELLLRLKANMFWPAMHKVTRPFNADPANAALADRYAIVMGSSHAEPMLRNNVGEWTAPAADFDYVANADGVRRYWAERVDTNSGYESMWTLGMRGIHDSGMVGPTSTDDRRRVLERIFADQRGLLAGAGIAGAPQVFTPYKEVLDIYRAGLAVPDDVTLMWPDDNFGYIRHFPDAAERARPGGSGVYYHLSYLGAPLSYLWLSTTPPALIREEMGRAWDLGARRMWVANVGDLKPAELATDYFLALAWDVDATRAQSIDGWTANWAARTIAPALAAPVAAIMAEHHRLNFARRPEHLQWWLPNQKPRPSTLDEAEIAERLAAFDHNLAALDALEPAVPAHRRDAFFQLVRYPVEAAAMANRRVFASEAHDRLRDRDLPAAGTAAEQAHAADERIAALTRQYNETLAGGKWRGMIAPEPADGQWRSYRTVPVALPPRYGPTGPMPLPAAPPPMIVLEAETATGDWRRIEGLGRNGGAIGSRVDRPVSGVAALTLPPGNWSLSIELLPTYPDRDAAPIALDVIVNGRTLPVSVPRVTGDPAWAQAVLDNRITVELPGMLTAGAHRIGLRAKGGGVLVDRLIARPAR